MPIANVTFEPRSRNNWHIHKATKGGGQMLIGVAGRGWYQEEGKPAIEILPPINSGSKFFERILNILLENARIPPKETYVEKIIDLKNKKVIDSKSEKLLQKARKYRNDDRHSDSSSNERVALAFLKVIFNISVWFMDDYNNKIIHNSDFDTNILTQIEKESQVSKKMSVK